MIQYSSINDAWGNKETYKKYNKGETFQNTTLKKESFQNNNLVDHHTNIKEVNEPVNKPVDKPVSQPIQVINEPINETLVQPVNQPINKVVSEPFTNNHHQQNMHHKFIERFYQNENRPCNIIEHLKNCPECVEKMRELFTNNNDEDNYIYSKINIFGLKINITKDVLKIVFILLIVLIFIVFLSIINVPLIGNNSSSKYYLVPQNELSNLIRIGGNIM
jgi:hypothetical protein